MQKQVTNSASIPDAWAVARALAHSNRKVDLNGIVTNTKGSSTLALTLALAAITILAGLIWPMGCAIGILVLVISAMADVDGGKGWVRNLLVKDISHTVIVWPDEPSAGEQGTVDADSPPQPTLLIVAPLEENVRSKGISVRLLFLPFTLSIAGCIAAISSPWFGPEPAIGLAIAVSVASITTWAFAWADSNRQHGNPARETWHATFNRGHKEENIRLVWALVGGGTVHFDGLETLLKNHTHRLNPTTTRIVCLHPSTVELAAVASDGRIRGRNADPTLLAIADSVGLQTRSHLTGASQARRCGHRAMGITVTKETTDDASRKLSEIVAKSDQLVRDQQW
ncbi:MAG: hypothetical protein ACPGTU_17295 [Myxococcota bacterium]